MVTSTAKGVYVLTGWTPQDEAEYQALEASRDPLGSDDRPRTWFPGESDPTDEQGPWEGRMAQQEPANG